MSISWILLRSDELLYGPAPDKAAIELRRPQSIAIDLSVWYRPHLPLHVVILMSRAADLLQ